MVSSFVLAEMSDKTTLATVTLASDHDWTGVWIGTTVGMVLADGLAIGVGRLLHRRLPEHLLHVLAGLLFLMFGLWMLFDSALGWRSVAIAVTVAVAVVAATVAAAQTLRRRRPEASTRQGATGRRLTCRHRSPRPAASGSRPQRVSQGCSLHLRPCFCDVLQT